MLEFQVPEKAAAMEKISLDRFRLEGLLGSGSDYEVHAAFDTETGASVVVKRPKPDYVARGLHSGIDLLSQALIDIHASVANSVPAVCRMLGYTDVGDHGSYFDDEMESEYRALVFERARGIPLVADIGDKFKGVPIGLGQNLFALHPAHGEMPDGPGSVQTQILDVEESFVAAGHLLLDMRPQNIYYDPADGKVSVIDVGTVPTHGPGSQGQASSGGQAQDIHNFFAEVFRFYVCPGRPPNDPAGYGEPYGMRAPSDFGQHVDGMIDSFLKEEDRDLGQAAVETLQKVRWRRYASVEEFRTDLQHCLEAVSSRDNLHDQGSPGLEVWRRARKLLEAPYWKRFLFEQGQGA